MSLEDKHIQDVSARRRHLQKHGISLEMHDFMVTTCLRIAKVLNVSPEDIIIEHTPIIRKLVGQKIKQSSDKDLLRGIAKKIIQDHTAGVLEKTTSREFGDPPDSSNIVQQGNRLCLGSTELTYDPEKKSLERHLSIRGKVSPTSNTLKSELRELLKQAKESFPEATTFVSNTWLNAVPKLVPWYDMYVQYEQKFGQNPLQDSEHDMQSLSSWGQVVKSDGTLRATITDSVSNNVGALTREEGIKKILPTPRKSVVIPLDFVYKYFDLK